MITYDESDRQSGRTSRMLEKAYKLVKSGKRVRVLSANTRISDYCRSTFKQKFGDSLSKERLKLVKFKSVRVPSTKNVVELVEEIFAELAWEACSEVDETALLNNEVFDVFAHGLAIALQKKFHELTEREFT